MRVRVPNVSILRTVFWASMAVMASMSMPFGAHAATSKTKMPKAVVSKSSKAKPEMPVQNDDKSTIDKSSGSATSTVQSTQTAETAKTSAAFDETVNSDERPVGSAAGELSTTTFDSWRRSKQTKLAYKIGAGFDSFANEREQSQYFGLRIGSDLHIQLAEEFGFRAKGSVNLVSGYAQSRWGDNVASNGFILQEALLSGRLLDTSVMRLYVAGGAIDQGQFDAPMFVSRQAFPGVKETLVLGSSKDFKVRIWAQQTIPTSKNLSTKTIDAEVTPSFLTETVELSVQPLESFEAHAGVTHYAFNNLPSAIALESVIYGNTVDEVGPNTSRFKYRFDGLMAAGGVSLALTPKFKWLFDGYALQNNAAPEGYRLAQHIQTGFKIGLPGEIEISPKVGSFFIEDDAVPGFYNSSGLGHGNRKGFNAALDTYFQRQRFKLRAEYVDADVINYNINQSRQQTLMIGFETFYEIL